MNSEDLLDKQIENYIHERMAPDEKGAFEKSLAEDVKLRNKVFELIELKSLYNKELFELKKKLDAAEKNLEQEKFFKEDEK